MADTLRIEENVQIKSPVVISYQYDAEKNYFNRMQIIAEKDSEIEVIFIFSSDKNSSGTVIHQLLVDAKEEQK